VQRFLLDNNAPAMCHDNGTSERQSDSGSLNLLFLRFGGTKPTIKYAIFELFPNWDAAWILNTQSELIRVQIPKEAHSAPTPGSRVFNCIVNNVH